MAYDESDPTLPASVETSVGMARAKHATTVDMSSQELEATPRGLRECRRVLTLLLQDNQIASIQAKAMPRRMEKVVLTDNQLEALPEDLRSYTALKELFLGSNRLTNADSIWEHPSLEHAGLSYNLLHSISPSPASNLLSLDISHNDFCDLAQLLEGLSVLPRLQLLSIQGNPLCLGRSWAAAVLDAMPKLHYLDGKKREHAQEQVQDRALKDAALAASQPAAGAEGDVAEAEAADAASGSELLAGPLILEVQVSDIKVTEPPLPPVVADPDGVPPEPLRFHVQYTGLDGSEVGALPLKLLPQIAEPEPAKGKKGGKGGGGSKGKANAAEEEPRPKLPLGFCHVALPVPAVASSRNWLRNGFVAKLIRTPPPDPAAAAATPEEATGLKDINCTSEHPSPDPSVQAAEQPPGNVIGEALVLPELLCSGWDSEWEQEVAFMPPPRLWDDSDLRMALEDPRHASPATGTAVFRVRLLPCLSAAQPSPPTTPPATP